MTPFNPTDRLTASLEAQQWNQLLGLLHEVSAPARVTVPIIQALSTQLSAQGERQDDVDTNVVPMSG